MLVKEKNSFLGFVDGRSFLIGSPYRSPFFLSASILGAIALLMDAYVLYRFRKSLNLYSFLVLGVLIGVQIVYQWCRVIRYYSKIREHYLMGAENEREEGDPLDVALRIAAGGLTDVLFYFNGTVLVALVLIAALLSHR